MEEIRFVKDDLAQEREENIRALMSLIEEKPLPKEVFVAKRFMVSVMHAARSIRGRKIAQQKMAENKKNQSMLMPKIIRKQPTSVTMPSEEKQELPVVNIPKEPHIEEKLMEIKPEIKPLEITSRREYPIILSATQTLAKTIIDFDHGKLKYNISEPEINPKILEKTIDLLGRKLKKDPMVLRDDNLLTKKIEKACKKNKIEFTKTYFENIKYYLYRDYLHFGKIDPLVMDNNVLTIICEGVNRPVSIKYITNQVFDTNIVFASNEEINNILFMFAKVANKELNANQPILSATIGPLSIEATLGLEEISSRFIIKKQAQP